MYVTQTQTSLLGCLDHKQEVDIRQQKQVRDQRRLLRGRSTGLVCRTSAGMTAKITKVHENVKNEDISQTYAVITTGKIGLGNPGRVSCALR